MAFLFKETPIARKNHYLSAIGKVAKTSYALTDKALHTFATANRPFVSRNAHFMADRISYEINMAILLYKQRRYSAHKANFAALLKDVIQLVWEVIWAFIGPFLYALMMTVVYAAISVSVFGLIFYLIFIL